MMQRRKLATDSRTSDTTERPRLDSVYRLALPRLTLACLCASTLLFVTGCRLFHRDSGAEGAMPIAPDRNVVTTDDRKKAEQHVDEAEKALNTGNKDAALAAFAAAIEVNPRIVQAHMGMAEIYKERKQWPEAEKQYGTAVELEPENYEARYNHGFALQMLNRIVEAIREYRQALVIQPNSHEANLNIATAYLQLNMPQEALPFAVRAVQLEPNHGPSHANLGTIYSAVGNDAEAIKQYKSAMDLMAPSPELMLNYIESLRKVRQYPEMVNVTAALIRLKPSADAYERLGYGYFKMRDYAHSEEAYHKSIEMDRNYYPGMNGLAVNLLNDYIRSNRTNEEAHQQAIDLLRRSLQIETDQPKIVELLSRYGR